METLFNNKNFIKASIALMVLLSLFVLALFINEVKASPYVGHSSQTPSTISVSGKGEVMAVSDIATLSITLTKDASTSKQAQQDLNDSITKTLNYLKSQKIEDKDIKSEYGGINPKYSNSVINCFAYPCPQPDPKITGYTATQSITVKVRAVDSASDIRTGLANLGITNISGPTFSIDDEDTLKAGAREKAIDDAKAKAQTLARELGVHLGKVASFNEDAAGGYPIMYESKAMNLSADSAAPAPVLPKGENKITSNVTIVYEIR
jgi:uncharacterized protein YggE